MLLRFCWRACSGGDGYIFECGRYASEARLVSRYRLFRPCSLTWRCLFYPLPPDGTYNVHCSTYLGGLVSEHMQVLITMVYHHKGTCICSLTNRSTQVHQDPGRGRKSGDYMYFTEGRKIVFRSYPNIGKGEIYHSHFRSYLTPMPVDYPFSLPSPRSQ